MPSLPSQSGHLESEALSRILEVTRLLGAPISLQTMLQRVIDAARQVLGAERGTVFLYDSKTNELYSSVATGVEEVRVPVDRGIVGRCASGRTVVRVADCYADPMFNPEVDRATGYRTRCLLSVPLIGDQDELVGVMQILNKNDGTFNESDEKIATALAAQCAVALQRAKLMEDRLIRVKLENDMNVARDIQKGGLPDALPKAPGYDLAGWSQPAEETGGDIYDAVSLSEGRILLLLGDATGHGIGPALSVVQVRAMVRMAARLNAGLAETLRHVNDQLRNDLADNRFVTLFLGLLDTSKHLLNYHSAGQGPLMHFQSRTGKFRWLDASALPLAVSSDLDLEVPPPIELAIGDIVAIISDGVLECRGAHGKRMGVSGVAQIVTRHQHGTMDHLLRALRAAVQDHAGDQPQEDDMTALILKRK